MKIELFTFKKRNNSTSRPTNGTDKEVVLKNATSLYNPTFILSEYENWNYLKWNEYYYYIDDVVYTRNGVFELQCSIDVLASFKNEILNTNAFVLYSTTDYDTSIIDTRLSMKDECIQQFTFQNVRTTEQGMYIISYIGDQADSNPTVAVTQTQLINILNAIQSNAFAELFNDPTNAINKILSDTASCITSCIYNPLTNAGGEKNVVLAGGYDTNIVGKKPLENITKYFYLDIPWNFSENDFRNRSQFSSMSIYLPGYGWLDLNIDNFIGKTQIEIRINIDSTIGELSYSIMNESKVTCNIGTQIQVSTVTKGNVGQFVGNTIGAVGSFYGGFVGGTIASGFNAITSLLQNTPGSVGSMGGATSFNIGSSIILIIKSHDSNINPSDMASVYGRPLNKVKKIGDLSGYCQTNGASVNVVNTDIANRINSLLDGGVYLE